MPFTIAHATQAVGTDAGNGEIRKAQWNENHTPTFTSSFLRNRIINGDMRIDQRNEGASVSVSSDGVSFFGVDRTFATKSTTGVFSVQRSTTAPNNFSYSLKATVTTADAAVAAGDYAAIIQYIEGYNVADLAFGTANAQTVTLSFWVQSSLTGTYAVSICNATGARTYVATYTVNSANTWEYKTVTIAGDTTGTWATDNTTGLAVRFGLMAGSTFQQTAGSWGTTNALGTSATVNWMGTLSNTFYVSGVQLEVGSTATAFERRPYAQEAYLCQRYYQKSYEDVVPATATTNGYVACCCAAPSGFGGGFSFPVAMRASPTFSYWDSAGNASRSGYYNTAWVTNNNFFSTVAMTKKSGYFVVNVGISATLFIHYTAEAEL